MEEKGRRERHKGYKWAVREENGIETGPSISQPRGLVQGWEIRVRKQLYNQKQIWQVEKMGDALGTNRLRLFSVHNLNTGSAAPLGRQISS